MKEKERENVKEAKGREYAYFNSDLQTHLFEIVNNIDLSRGIGAGVAITCDVKGFCFLFGVNFYSFV